MKKIIFWIGTIVLILLLLGTAKHIKENRGANEQIEKSDNPIDQIDGTLDKNSLSPGDYKFIVKQRTASRYYLLHVPKSYDGSSTRLILAFHGGLGTAESIQTENYGWIEKSDEEGFIVAFPNGASRQASGKFATWNAGNCCGYANKSDSDDVGFVKLIINDIKKKTEIDKIFATGMSNGGMFSYRLACEMSDVFTAIAAVAGTLNYDNCNPVKPISIMHIHGLLDDHVLFDGGCGPKCVTSSETDHVSIQKTISRWKKINNCDDIPKRVLSNKNGYCDLYFCANETQVKLCVAEDGGHSWPGMKISSGILEKMNPHSQAFSATDEIWDFFKSQFGYVNKTVNQ